MVDILKNLFACIMDIPYSYSAKLSNIPRTKYYCNIVFQMHCLRSLNILGILIDLYPFYLFYLYLANFFYYL